KQNKTIEIGIYGGSAIVLSWEFRKSTMDVDVVIYNDVGYLKEERQLFLELPENSETKGLRVFTPTPEYLLAMKCMAMRIGDLENSSDIEDIKILMPEIYYN
ncbi:MAG: hypothetical protein M0012_07260, partial [Deltaproteobacteria bacterium]|nr:hypothetical protein [Deltaproteobacteria bacterium]